MKKTLALLLALIMVFALVGCAGGGEEEGGNDVDIFAKSEGVMTYAFRGIYFLIIWQTPPFILFYIKKPKK